MPEGDTIHRAARVLNTALGGKRVTRFETVLAQLARVDDQSPIAGRTIERVYAVGKHLLIAFSGDLVLRTHMRMNGSWHIYRSGERWQRPRRDMRIVIETSDYVAVAFNVPVAEFHTAASLAREDDIRKLGPDLLAETFDLDAAVRRARARANDEIANVLLNQRVIAGIGNVYKSEALFVCEVNPFRLVRELSDEQLASIIATSREMMQRNVRPGARERRTTRSANPDEALWVYSRGGEPCRRCGTPIEYAKQGIDVRGTYWCPKCQT